MNWAVMGKNCISKRAVDIYLEKNCKTVIQEPPSERPCLEAPEESET